MAQPTITTARNDGSSTVTVSALTGVALQGSQTNSLSFGKNYSGTSVQATVTLPGYTPIPGTE